MNKYFRIFVKTSVSFGFVMGLMDALKGKDILEFVINFVVTGIVTGIFFGAGMAAFGYIVDKKFRKNKNGDDLPQAKDIIFNRPIGEVTPVCRKAILSIRKSRVTSEEDNGKSINARIGISWKSCGEKVNISAKEIDPHKTAIHISSVPFFKSTMIDYGKNQENVKAIEDHLTGALGPAIVDA